MTTKDQQTFHQTLAQGGSLFDFLREHPQYSREEVEAWLEQGRRTPPDQRIHYELEDLPPTPQTLRRLIAAWQGLNKPARQKGDA